MKILEAKAELERHRGRTNIKLDELVEIANHLISLVVPEQPSDRVAGTLNERTFRYYITEGLIDRPLGKEGTAALYGYRHLLQTLIVKALQGAFLPIKRIKTILAGKSDRELECLLACQPLEMSGDSQKSGPLDAMLEEIQEMDVYSAMLKAASYMNYLDEIIKPPASIDKIGAETPSFRQEIQSVVDITPKYSIREPRSRGNINRDSWERFSLEDGFELNVRADRLKGLRSSEIKRILERMRNLLKTRK